MDKKDLDRVVDLLSNLFKDKGHKIHFMGMEPVPEAEAHECEYPDCPDKGLWKTEMGNFCYKHIQMIFQKDAQLHFGEAEDV